MLSLEKEIGRGRKKSSFIGNSWIERMKQQIEMEEKVQEEMLAKKRRTG